MSCRRFSACAFLVAGCTLVVSPASADRGRTGADESCTQPAAGALDDTGRTSRLPSGAPLAEPSTPDVTRWTSDPAWGLVQELGAWRRLKVGEQLAVKFDHVAQALVELAPADTLTAKARQAVERAPRWLQKPLEDLFARLSTARQDAYADPILGAADPYVDEIAFEVAHLAPQDLANASFYAQLITDNAQQLYAIDADAAYAEIVDYGDAATGGDYWSTLRYRVDEGGTIETWELPRDVYYWFVVHPRGSDELPTYINPSATCSSGGTPTAPPAGKFWRNWLFYGATNEQGGQCDNDQDGSVDGPCPVLKDMLADVTVLWKGLRDTNGAANGAVGVVNDWVRRSLGRFGDVDGCRPVQPVTIYYNMDGNCGEWGDLTMAAARAALIPTITLDAAVNDHVWNEFWERRWIQWEPVNNMIDSPGAYDSWWASHGGMASVNAWRGDGYGWSGEAALYTPHATLTVTVKDRNGYPVDGARVRLGSEMDALPVLVNTITQGHTDDRGKVTFTIGDTRNFYVNVHTTWGDYPTSGWTKVVTAAVAGTAYDWSPPNFNGAVPRLSIAPAPPPGDPADDYLLEATYTVEEELLHGDGYGTGISYTAEIAPGNLDAFVVDSNNWNLFNANAAFDAYDIALDGSAGAPSLVPPAPDDWYTVWSNDAALNLAQVVAVTERLYVNTGAVPPVTRLLVAKDASGAALLDWEDVAGQNVDGYHVYRSGSAADVGGGRTQDELAPFLLAFSGASEYADASAVPGSTCAFYSVRTHSRRGGISP